MFRAFYFFLAFACVGCSFRVLAQQKNADTIKVFFDLNSDDLDDRSKAYLDSLNYRNILVSGKGGVGILGRTDYLASNEYNIGLSQRRAEAVKKYLLNMGIRKKEIFVLLALGEEESQQEELPIKGGIRADRRVDIIMLRGRKPDTVSRSVTLGRARPKEINITLKPGRKKEIPPSSTDSNFDINKIEVGRTFILKNIYFPMGRHFPRDASFVELDRLLKMLNDNPTIRIHIEGHICCVDRLPDAFDLDTHQMDLSLNRARFVYDYLKGHGIADSRLGFDGYGKSRPIIPDEQTEEQASINRRVEIRIVER
jgi:outer membrane protein OmpA-like peptidoglycan-associated protein